jgi:hypothetical protein
MILTEESIIKFVHGAIANSPAEQKKFLLVAKDELKDRHIGHDLSTNLLLGLKDVESLTVYHLINHLKSIK